MLRAASYNPAGSLTQPFSALTFKAADGTALAPAYTFASETSLGFYRGVAGQLNFSSGGIAQIRFGAGFAEFAGQIILSSEIGLADSRLSIDAANILTLRNGAVTQTFRVGPSTGYTVVSDAGIGYATGLGGTVVQATSKATGATLNKVTGEITTAGDALLASTAVSFVLTNSLIAAKDHVLVSHVSGGTAGGYTSTALAAAGSATITIRNVSLASLSEALVLKFSVFKSVTA